MEYFAGRGQLSRDVGLDLATRRVSTPGMPVIALGRIAPALVISLREYAPAMSRDSITLTGWCTTEWDAATFRVMWALRSRAPGGTRWATCCTAPPAAVRTGSR